MFSAKGVVTCPKCSHSIVIQSNITELLGWKLRSGLNLELTDRVSWCVIGEIFIDGCYRPAWDLISIPKSSPLRIVDLGSNVGLFSLWAIDKCIWADQAFVIEAVDACPVNCKRYAERFEKQIGPHILPAGSSMKLTQGAVGLRSGEIDLIIMDDFHAMTTTYPEYLAKNSTISTVRVPWVDLDQIIAPGEIDLLKCDIEGRELDFVKTYQNTLLSRTNVVIAEIHKKICTIEEVDRIMYSAGFKNDKICEPENIKENQDTELHIWWK